MENDGLGKFPVFFTRRDWFGWMDTYVSHIVITSGGEVMIFHLLCQIFVLDFAMPKGVCM